MNNVTAFRFLLIDDDPDLRYLNRWALQREFPGCDVIEAESCEGAVEKSAGLKADATVADHHLQGQSGIECISLLRSNGIGGVVIMVTSNLNPALRDEALAAGANEVFLGGMQDFVAYLRQQLKSH